ncbi:MAG: NAD(P)-dependent oxidoreductase [Pirellulaceae bacterium]|jgi:S-adenosylhomocysteine hydrolase
MSNPDTPNIHLSRIEWTQLKSVTTRLMFGADEKSVLLTAIARAIKTDPRNAPWANLARINGYDTFFIELFDLLQTIEEQKANRALVEWMHKYSLNAKDKAYLESLLKGDVRIKSVSQKNIDHLWHTCLDLANQITELPAFLNEQIAKGGAEIRIDHIPNAMNTVRVGLPQFKIEVDNSDYADAQNSLKELHDRYNGYIDLLNKGSQRTVSLEKINKYFKEELEEWIGECFLPTMQRVCSKPKAGSQSALIPTQQRDPSQEFIDELYRDPFRNFQMMDYFKQLMVEKLGRPFEGLKCMVILHLLPDLAPFLESCEALGMDPKSTVLFYKPRYKYPHRDAFVSKLKSKGFLVLPLGKEDDRISVLRDYLDKMKATGWDSHRPILVIEDGGYIAPEILRRQQQQEFEKSAPRVVGFVEQTRRGIMNVEDVILQPGAARAAGDPCSTKVPFPLLSLPGAKIKLEIEPPIIGRGAVRGLELLTGRLVPGARVAVLGAGAIGLKVIEQLLGLNCRVRVYDQDETRRLNLHHIGGIELSGSSVEAVRNADFIIGCSGRQSINAEVIEAAKHGAYLVSASSETYEIDSDYLRRRSSSCDPLGMPMAIPAGTQSLAGYTYSIRDRNVQKELHLIADGIPVTFWGFSGMPCQFADLVMTLILLASGELAHKNRPGQGKNQIYENGILDGAIDSIVANYGVPATYLRMFGNR